MRSIIGIILIVAGIYAGYKGYQNLSNSTASAEIGEVEISVSDEKDTQEGYLLIGAGLVALVGGFYLTGRKN